MTLEAVRGGVIVTGGGGGIGAAVATRFAAQGYGVVVSDLGVTVAGDGPTPTAADAVVRKIHAVDGHAVAHHGSVTDFAVARQLVTLAVQEFGHLAGLVTCHGILRERMIFNMSEDEFDSVIAVHLKGTFNCVRHASAQMRIQRGGSMVLLSSAAGMEGSPAQANYAAAKAGIVGLASSVALAMGKYGVNVNTVVPAAATRMTARLNERMAGTRPDDERQGPELVAALAVSLCGTDLRRVTGQVLTAAGHRLARWEPAHEAASVDLISSFTQNDVTEALLGPLDVQPLRRFATLGLPQPSIPTPPHSVTSNSDPLTGA